MDIMNNLNLIIIAIEILITKIIMGFWLNNEICIAIIKEIVFIIQNLVYLELLLWVWWDFSELFRISLIYKINIMITLIAFDGLFIIFFSNYFIIGLFFL